MSFLLTAECDLKGGKKEVVGKIEGPKPRGVRLCSRDGVKPRAKTARYELT
jgi:hypothetical protein